MSHCFSLQRQRILALLIPVRRALQNDVVILIALCLSMVNFVRVHPGCVPGFHCVISHHDPKLSHPLRRLQKDDCPANGESATTERCVNGKT